MKLLDKIKKTAKDTSAKYKQFQADAPKREKARIEKLKLENKRLELENKNRKLKQQKAKTFQELQPGFGFDGFGMQQTQPQASKSKKPKVKKRVIEYL